MTRQAWRDFLCSPDRASRHLSNIGRNVFGAVGDAIDVAELQAFLECLHDDSDIRLLGTSVDLIAGDYLKFVETTLPDLLDSLSNEMVAREQVVGPGLRGNPLWDRTITKRISGQLRPGHYVSRTAHRSFDLPENSALAWLVADLNRCVASIERRTGTAAMHNTLERIRSACGAASEHHWFGDVPAPSLLGSEMMQALLRHRQPGYRHAARLIRRRRELAARESDAWWYSILSLLAVNWLEPIDDDDLFELFTLAMVIEIVAVDLGFGSPVEYSLVTARRGHIALFQRDGTSVRVFFDQSPSSAVGAKGEYAGVVSNHDGVSGSARRPDVLVVADNGQFKRTVMVEAKRSADGRYISDSIYKVFGYLYDYRTMVSDGSLRALLVIPEGVSASAAAPVDRELQVVPANRRDQFAFAMAGALGLTDTSFNASKTQP